MTRSYDTPPVSGYLASDTDTVFAQGGEMGALMRATDWSTTKLGPVESWPQSLKTMLGVVLGSRFPMLLWWGPDLLHLYNDAYRPILRDKHPASLAAPAAEVWAEVWSVAGPMARSVQAGGPATWTEDLQLFIASGPMAEETYFTFSYSPVPGDDGHVGGILNTVQETTVKVQSERQIRMLHDLAARVADAKSEDTACKMASEVLSGNELDLPFFLFYLMDQTGTSARLVASSGFGEYTGPANSATVLLEGSADSATWPLGEMIRSGHEVVVDELLKRFGALPMGRWNARAERAIILPLLRAGQSVPQAVFIAGISPHRTFDDRYRRFYQATADQLSNILSNACAYAEAKKRAESLAELDRAKTAFFSNVSHEFRTPLTLILGPVEDALSGASKSLQGEDLQTVHRSSIRLLRLVNSLLDFARIEAGRLQLRFVPTNLSAFTAGLASSFHSLLERAGLKLLVNCQPIPAPVYVDPPQWEKIVLNLISNAFKFTFAGEIEVALRSQGGQIELSVRDTGTGIPKTELPHLFDRFHRVEGAKGRSFEGTGIGLSLVQELVKLHGGTVRVSSEEGKGSTFTVSLPSGSDHLPLESVVNDKVQLASSAGTEPYLLEAAQWLDPAALAPDLEDPACADSLLDADKVRGAVVPNRARILLVDDNTDMRAYLRRLLSGHWLVDTAEDGEAALSLARRNQPDLVVSDVMMPRLDGFGLLGKLRADPLTRGIPVILLSARAGEEPLLKGLETGADDYLVKPFSARELLARIRTHLNMSRLRRQWMTELEQANRDLESFSYSVSHDLRAPLRSIEGFTRLILDRPSGSVDAPSRQHLERVCRATELMGRLIDDMLSLSKLSNQVIRKEPVDLSSLAREVVDGLKLAEPMRRVEVQIAGGMCVSGDLGLLRILLTNLIGNAWKFSGRKADARIVCGVEPQDDGQLAYFVRDNGAGFDMAYAMKLFGVFQRLHTSQEFPGTGIGLATVQRVVRRHGGRVWAEGKVGEGATFYFTI